MRSRTRHFEVYSLSAIDLFASAMGAFIIISIILMPDYQKEVRSIGDLEYLEELAGQTQALLDETEQGRKDVLDALLAAARAGSRTILIDRFDCPGGNIGPGFDVLALALGLRCEVSARAAEAWSVTHRTPLAPR